MCWQDSRVSSDDGFQRNEAGWVWFQSKQERERERGRGRGRARDTDIDNKRGGGRGLSRQNGAACCKEQVRSAAKGGAVAGAK